MSTVVWDWERVILVGAMLRRETINSDTYIRTPTEVRKHFKRVWPHNRPREILLQHDNARLHTSLKTLGAITKFGWTVLPHPSYSPDLAASNFNLFRDLKNVVCGTKCETNDDVIHAVRIWLHEQDKAWYQQGIHKCTRSLLAMKWAQTLWIESNRHASHCVIFMI
jgi:histone-lysine N-methyltransferase SETMAR